MSAIPVSFHDTANVNPNVFTFCRDNTATTVAFDCGAAKAEGIVIIIIIIIIQTFVRRTLSASEAPKLFLIRLATANRSRVSNGVSKKTGQSKGRGRPCKNFPHI